MRSRGLLVVLCVLGLSTRAYGQVFDYTTTAEFDGGTKVLMVDLAPADQLQLAPTPVSSQGYVWSTNYLYGFVVKLRASDGKQVARYDSALQFMGGVPTGARPANEYCDFATTGNCPGRLAVDTYGDAWVVNRAFGHQGTLTRIAGDISRCVDRNGNGLIETSTDASGDGLISVVGGAGEYVGQNDECILTTLSIGPNNVYPRGVAIDVNGKIWVSTFTDGKIYRYNPATTTPTLEATVTIGGTPYSLASGGNYVIASNAGAGGTKRVHITTLVVNTLAACPGTYGIVADPGGDIAWLGGYFTGNGIYKANFATNTCTLYATGSTTTAITLDLAGNVWACGYNTNTIHKFSPAGVLLGTYPAGGTSPHGMSVDFAGNLWVLNHGPTPNLSKVNVNTGAILGTYALGGPGVPNADPYCYADFTGTQINRQAPYARAGSWSKVSDGGVNAIPWATVTWNTEPQGAVPAGTTLAVSVRANDDLAALALAPFVPVAASGDALAGVVGRYLEVQVLAAGGVATPVLSDLSVIGPCVTSGDGCCLSVGDCDDANLCTADVCAGPGAVCAHGAIAGCCNADVECSDGDLCTVDSCSGLGGSCGTTPVAGCCNVDVNCDDTNLCTTDTCSGPGGACTLTPVAGCCNVDVDCDDTNLCTTDTCSGPGGACTLTPVAGCCNVDTDCDDADMCTADTCSGPGGACTLTPLAGCCNGDGDCDDGDACTTGTCSGPGGACTQTPVASCCNVDADCDDGDACTTGSCSGAGGACTQAPIDGCCNAAADCNDSDPCTDDACTGAGGTCTHTPMGAGCCTVAADCDDSDVCTTDTCAGGMSCGHDAIAGCCNVDAECSGGTCLPDHTCQAPLGGDSGGCDCRVGERRQGSGTAPLGQALPGGLLAFGLLLGGRLRRRRRR